MSGFSGFSLQTPTSTTPATGLTGLGTPTQTTPTGFSLSSTPSASTTGFSLTTPSTPSTSATGFSLTTPQPGTGLGVTPSTSTGFSLAPSTPSTGFSLSTTNPNPATSGTSGFSIPSAAPSNQFSLSTTAPANPTSFSLNPQPSMGFGGLTGGMGSSLGNLNPQTSTWSTSVPAKTPQQRLSEIVEAYNPSSAGCRFRHTFYNKVDKADLSKYVKPPNVDEMSWRHAIESNPDPERLVPVLATGIEDLRKRIAAQDEGTAMQLNTLKDTQKIITSLTADLETTITNRIDLYKIRYLEIAHRMLKIMTKLEVLKSSGYSITREEDIIREKLKNIHSQLNLTSSFKGKINELLYLSSTKDYYEEEPIKYSPLEEDSLEAIHNFLFQQTKGLANLCDVINQDANDLRILRESVTGEPTGIFDFVI